MMEFLPILVTIVGIIMPFGYLLQTMKIIKTKSSKDVAIKTYYILLAGFFVWLAYGISLKDIPIIIANIVAIFCSASTIVATLIYRK